MTGPLSVPLSGALPVGAGRVVVPQNRWDLVPPRVGPLPSDAPTVTVVVPYYRQPRQLSLVLQALDRQTYPAERIEVVIADDGSPEPPPTGDRPNVTVVRQEDRGFRAARARNLGVRASSGDVLCFLDADTVPEPGYVDAITALPAAMPDAVTVGRRRHADLSAWQPADGPPPPAIHLTEPRWLVDAYAGSRNLLDADWGSYRHIISAVMCCSRALFIELGGFDESFGRYGGEDWELANRAYVNGAVLAHVPSAVAWHDGPDWAERADENRRRDDKTAEALALSRRITEPNARRHRGFVRERPDAVVTVDTRRHTPGSLAVTLDSLLSHLDCRIWLTGDEAVAAHLELTDPRVRFGSPGADDAAFSRFEVHLDARAVMDDASTPALLAAVGPAGVGRVHVRWPDGASMSITARRARMRAERWCGALGCGADDALTRLFGSRDAMPEDFGVRVGDAHPDLSW